MKKKWLMALACAGVFGVAQGARAQSVVQVVDAIDHARVSTRILYVTAHPDDERSSVLTYLSRGLGATVALCSTTRGEGGQNAIGPELGPALEILRTNELYEATQVYGIKLFFTRAPDFGFSKSPEETLKIWNGVAKEDLVRILRTFRPDIVINQWGGVHSGHGQHQATGIVVPEAVEAAADASAYPEQIKEGLRPWKVARVLQFARQGEGNGGVSLPVGDISPLWGESYADLGLKGFANHRSQGITRVLDSSFLRRPVNLAVVEGAKMTAGDFAQPLTAIGGGSDKISAELRAADDGLAQARESALRLDWPATVKSLAAAGSELGKALAAGANAEQTWRLQQQKKRIDRALAEAAALHLTAESSSSALVGGEKFTVRLNWEERSDVGVQLEPPSLQLPAGWSASPAKSGERDGDSAASAMSALFSVQVPEDATTPSDPEDAILPWHPPLVEAQIAGTVNGYKFSYREPAVAHEYTSTTVETMPLEIVPAVTLTIDPDQIMLPTDRPKRAFELLARVSYHGSVKAHVEPGVEAPRGWSVSPVAPIDFSEAGSRLARFTITPPANAAAGAYALKPYARLGARTFSTSYEALPDLPSRHVSEPAEASAHILNLAIPSRLRVGYIAAGIDPVPQTLTQLGISVTMLDEAALEFGDLSRFDAIVVGIRAYELRPDVMSANRRLLSYVTNGGTLLVQYERDFSWDKLLPAPFPARENKPNSGFFTSAPRVTDENSPVRFLNPSSPLLNYPNRITQTDFKGWIQERGLYFWGQWDPRYKAVLAMHDPGEPDALGGLVWARDGKGIYIYTGLAFFRQLPAGVPGAYRLFVNLLSASRAPAKK
ncbi:MAG TPA: PIG-L family deacetylase [Candidatus Acidoferrales bacterium]|nr:PIG-L family deacetylase [Candidatus Acidoferrales bacterium]